jgi:hypothetical protein
MTSLLSAIAGKAAKAVVTKGRVAAGVQQLTKADKRGVGVGWGGGCSQATKAAPCQHAWQWSPRVCMPTCCQDHTGHCQLCSSVAPPLLEQHAAARRELLGVKYPLPPCRVQPHAPLVSCSW